MAVETAEPTPVPPPPPAPRNYVYPAVLALTAATVAYVIMTCVWSVECLFMFGPSWMVRTLLTNEAQRTTFIDTPHRPDDDNIDAKIMEAVRAKMPVAEEGEEGGYGGARAK